MKLASPIKVIIANSCLVFIGILPISLPLSLFLSGVNSAVTQNSSISFRIKPSFLDPISVVRHLYKAVPMRNVLQYDSACFEPDTLLIYVPKKSASCLQSNLEYTATINFGHFGQRMSGSIKHLEPSLIVLGDSHALGWGVSDDQTFAHHLETNGIGVLNLAVSSYGTGRELQRLRQYAKTHPLDYAQVETILFVYNPNDIGENRSFLADDDLHRQAIDASIANYSALLSNSNPYHFAQGADPLSYLSDPKVSSKIIVAYWTYVYHWFLAFLEKSPLRTLVDFSTSSLQRGARSNLGDIPPASHGKLFYALLERNADLFPGKKIMVFISDDWGHDNLRLYREFVDECLVFCRSADISILPPVSSGPVPGDGSYYLIDDHLSPSGHLELAHSLLAILKCDNLSEAGNPYEYPRDICLLSR